MFGCEEDSAVRVYGAVEVVEVPDGYSGVWTTCVGDDLLVDAAAVPLPDSIDYSNVREGSCMC